MSRPDGQPAYVIPAHNLRATRPAPISFDAARAEALAGVGGSVHASNVAEGEQDAKTASRGGVCANSTQKGAA